MLILPNHLIFLTMDEAKLTLQAPTPQNGQTHSNNLSVIADELFVRLSILWDWH